MDTLKKILGKIQDLRSEGHFTHEFDNYTLDTLSNYIAHLDMELIETKPEENWYEINERKDREFRGEKPTKYQEVKRKGAIAREKADKLVEKPCLMEDDTLEMIREREEYDKSIMDEIPEVLEYKPQPYDRGEDSQYFDNSEIQIELLTNSLNAVIKKINNL